jgi:hypothetical protein
MHGHHWYEVQQQVQLSVQCPFFPAYKGLKVPSSVQLGSYLGPKSGNVTRHVAVRYATKAST